MWEARGRISSEQSLNCVENEPNKPTPEGILWSGEISQAAPRNWHYMLEESFVRKQV